MSTSATVYVRVTGITQNTDGTYTAGGLLTPYCGPIAVSNSCSESPIHRVFVRGQRGTAVDITFQIDPMQVTSVPVQDSNGNPIGIASTLSVGTVAVLISSPQLSANGATLTDANTSNTFRITISATYTPTTGKPSTILMNWDPGIDNEY